MQKTQDMLNNGSQGAESNKTLKSWETPQLRVLPVPNKTQGGQGNKNDQDDIFYKKS